MDSCTSALCEKQWGRPGFAKVLVEVFAVGSLKREVEVLIPDLNGGPDASVTVGVEYIWEPSQCSHCKVFGHTTNSCVKATLAKGKEKVNNTDEGGFTKVWKKQWRRKQGKPQVNQQPKGSEAKQTDKSKEEGKNDLEDPHHRDDKLKSNSEVFIETTKEDCGENVPPQTVPPNGTWGNGKNKKEQQMYKEGGQGKYDSKTPWPFLADIVKTYRTITRAKRGVFIEPVMTNRFSVLDGDLMKDMEESIHQSDKNDQEDWCGESGIPSTSLCQ